MMNIDNLKPCPFCSSKDLGISINTAVNLGKRKYHYCVYCKKCHCYGARILSDKLYHNRTTAECDNEMKNKAIEAWNRRNH